MARHKNEIEEKFEKDEIEEKPARNLDPEQQEQMYGWVKIDKNDVWMTEEMRREKLWKKASESTKLSSMEVAKKRAEAEFLIEEDEGFNQAIMILSDEALTEYFENMVRARANKLVPEIWAEETRLELNRLISKMDAEDEVRMIARLKNTGLWLEVSESDEVGLVGSLERIIFQQIISDPSSRKAIEEQLRELESGKVLEIEIEGGVKKDDIDKKNALLKELTEFQKFQNNQPDDLDRQEARAKLELSNLRLNLKRFREQQELHNEQNKNEAGMKEGLETEYKKKGEDSNINKPPRKWEIVGKEGRSSGSDIKFEEAESGESKRSDRKSHHVGEVKRKEGERERGAEREGGDYGSDYVGSSMCKGYEALNRMGGGAENRGDGKSFLVVGTNLEECQKWLEQKGFAEIKCEEHNNDEGEVTGTRIHLPEERGKKLEFGKMMNDLIKGSKESNQR